MVAPFSNMLSNFEPALDSIVELGSESGKLVGVDVVKQFIYFIIDGLFPRIVIQLVYEKFE